MSGCAGVAALSLTARVGRALAASVVAVALASCAALPDSGVAQSPSELQPSASDVTLSGIAAEADPAAPGPVAPVASIALRHPLPDVYTAAQPEQGDWAAIAAQGVTTVIDLRPSSERPGRDEAAEVAAAGLRYVQIPVADAAGLTAATADALWQAIDAKGVTLVHCASGNRVGALLALAAVRQGVIAPEDAVDFGRGAGMTSTEPRLRAQLAKPAEPAGVVVEPAPRRSPAE